MPECKTRHLQLGGDAVAVNGRQYFYTRKKSFSTRHFGIRHFTASTEHFEISRKHKLINIFAKAGPKKEKNIYLESSRKGEFDYVIVWKHSYAVQDIAVASRFLRNRTSLYCRHFHISDELHKDKTQTYQTSIEYTSLILTGTFNPNPGPNL